MASVAQSPFPPLSARLESWVLAVTLGLTEADAAGTARPRAPTKAAAAVAVLIRDDFITILTLRIRRWACPGGTEPGSTAAGSVGRRDPL
jgi:hypothetical protein